MVAQDADRLQDLVVVCKGGKVRNQGALLQGSSMTGTAVVLQNFEPSIEGGYRRIDGYSKYDSTEVPGTGPILGIKVSPGLQQVFAARLKADGTQVDIYKSVGIGWTKVNTSGQDSDAIKYRGISYSITEPAIIFCDGFGPAWKYTASGDVLINGSGAPTNPKFAEIHLARLVLSGYGDGSSISISVPNDDEDFSTAGTVEINVGDTVTGLRKFRGILYIFCLNSIWELSGTSIEDFQLNSVTNDIGCISGDTIQEVGGDLIYLSAQGFRSLAATQRLNDLELGIQSKEIQPEIRQLITATAYDENSYSSCVVASKSQYRMFLYDPDIATQDAKGFIGHRVFEEDTLGYEWSNIAGFNCYCADSAYYGREEMILHGDPSNGYVYRQERGNSRDGSNIFAVYTTPNIIFGNAELRKVMHWMRLHTQVEGTLDLNLQLLFDAGDPSVLQPRVIDITSSGAVSVYGVAVYGTDTYSLTAEPNLRKNLTGAGLIVSFTFSSNDTNASYRIDSFQIVFSPKGRR